MHTYVEAKQEAPPLLSHSRVENNKGRVQNGAYYTSTPLRTPAKITIRVKVSRVANDTRGFLARQPGLFKLSIGHAHQTDYQTLRITMQMLVNSHVREFRFFSPSSFVPFLTTSPPPSSREKRNGTGKVFKAVFVGVQRFLWIVGN